MNCFILYVDIMSTSAIEKINVNKWIKDNEAQFDPPVCNKLMYVIR